MVPAKARELEQLIVSVLMRPQSYVGGDYVGGTSLAQLAEALTAVPQWSWMSRDAIVESIEGSPRFRLEGPYVRLQREGDRPAPTNDDVHLVPSAVDSSAYVADPETSIDGYAEGVIIEVYPSSLWLDQLTSRRAVMGSGRTLVHQTVDAALKVSWALCGNLERAGVLILPESAMQAPVTRHPESDTAFLVGQFDPEDLRAVPGRVLHESFDAAREFVWLNEALYLDDPGAQSLAVRKLFKTGGQKAIETMLRAHLSDGDSGVKVNVLNALGLPAYSVGFAPGAPLPPRDERLEHVALDPDTVRSIIDLAARETDQDVLDAIVCTLSAQPFAQSLRLVANEVQLTLVDLVPRLQSEQSGRDARKIIREIRRLQ